MVKVHEKDFIHLRKSTFKRASLFIIGLLLVLNLFCCLEALTSNPDLASIPLLIMINSIVGLLSSVILGALFITYGLLGENDGFFEFLLEGDWSNGS